MARRAYILFLTAAFGCARPAATPASPPPSAQAACASPEVSRVSLPPMWIMSKGDPLMREVRFGQHSVEPLGGYVAEVDQVADALRSSARLELVAVSGHASQGEADELAARRAQRIIELLVARGVDRSRLEVRPPSSTAVQLVGTCGTDLSKEEEEQARAEAQAQDQWVRFSILRSNEK